MRVLVHRLFLGGVIWTLGCENSGPERDFERMVNQAYFLPYKECEFFSDKRAMRTPPEDTFSINSLQMPRAVERGVLNDSYIEKNPVLLTSRFVARGQQRFDVFCAPCHGALGDGSSVIAKKMTLRPPPSIVSERIRQLPDGRIFAVISEGYGLMPNYAHEIDSIDRWAIIAYVRALGVRAAGIRLEMLPEPLRRTAEESLP